MCEALWKTGKMAHTHKGNWFEENVLEETTGIRYYADPKDRSKQLLTKARVIEHSDQLPAKEYKSVMSTCITNQQDHPNYKTLKDKVGPRQAMMDAKLKQQVADEFTKRAADDYTENRRVRYVSDAMEHFNKEGFEPSLKVHDPFIRIPTHHADCCTDTAITFYSDSVKHGVTNFPCTFVTAGNPFKRCSSFSADIVNDPTIRKAESNERPRSLATVREFGTLQQMKQRLLDHIKSIDAAVARVPGRSVRIIVDTLYGMAGDNATGLHIEPFVNGFNTNLGGFSITSKERTALLTAFDTDSNNQISLAAFTEFMRGSLSPRAIELVDLVLAALAATEAIYNEGFVSERAILINFKGDVDALLSNLRVSDGQVAADEVFEYYCDVFAELGNGRDFEALLRSSWGI